MAALRDLKQMVTVTELDDLLQCPVCYDVPTGHIYQCNKGHHVCGDCKLRIDLCPVCRSMFFGTRNYAMEELISNIRKLKQAKSLTAIQKQFSTEDSGSSETTSSSSSNITLGLTDTDRTENASETSRRPPVMCPGLFRCLCCAVGRKERLPVARMLNHLRYWHSLDLIEGKLESEQYEQAWEIPMNDGRTVIAVRVVELGIFFLVIEIRSGGPPMELHSWLSMVASPIEADNFAYNLTFTGSDREATFSDAVMSVRSCEGQLKKRRRCLIIDNTNMQAFTGSQIVSVRLCIKRAAERRDDLLRPEPRAALRIANRSLSDAGSTNSINSLDRSFIRDIRIRDAEEILRQSLHDNNRLQQNARSQTQQNARSQTQQTQPATNTVRQINSAPQPQRNPANQARNPANQARNNAVQQNTAPQTINVAGQNNEGSGSAQSEAQLSRSARRRLRRRLNNVEPHLSIDELLNRVQHLGLVAIPTDTGRPPVVPTSARGQPDRNNRSHNRR